MKLSLLLLSLAVSSIVLSSCEKVIDVDLNGASPQIIIEGVITNTPGSYEVRITNTVHFTAMNNFPGVSGASVVITDVSGNITDTLSEPSPGIYTTHFIRGIPGHTYTLSVSKGGQVYTASSTMPTPVPLDSVAFERRINFNGSSIGATPCFQDPPGEANFYTFSQFVNNRKLEGTHVFGDRLSDGRYITQQLFTDSAYIHLGDTVRITMSCVDKNVWSYFNTLAMLSQGGIEAPAPANPTSNINNNALGYFSAQTSQSKAAVAY